MDFRFNAEEEAFRKEVHDFIEAECPAELRKGGVNLFEQAGSFLAWRKRVADKGWVAPAWPKEYGGAGMTIMQQFIYSLESARMHAPPPIYIGGLAVAVIGPTIIIYGTEEQKQEHIRPILAGKTMWCQGFSEPEAGSDLASANTRAVRDGDDYVINGQKIWTTLAHMSQYMLLLARTDPDAPKHKGLSYFIVPMNTPGVTVRPRYNLPGTHEFNEVFFDNVRIPARNLLGERYLETEVSLMLSYRLITMQNRGLIPNYEASATKLYSMELNQRIANTGLRLMGMYGQLARNSKWAPLKGRLEFQYLRSVANTIEGGTSEIQRNIVAQRGLGLPRE